MSNQCGLPVKRRARLVARALRSSVRAATGVVAASALVAGLLLATSTSASADTAPATTLAFTTAPASATGGTAFATQPVVTFQDGKGNTVSGTGVVTLTIAIGTNGNPTGAAGAVLVCPAVAAVGGVATFSGCAINKAGSGYELTATSGSLSVTSAPFNVAVGAPAAVAFTTQPASITAGITFAHAPTVAVTDAGGNVITSGTDHIGLATVTGAGAGPLVCNTATGGETAAPATAAPGYALSPQSPDNSYANGAASFAGCTIDQASSNMYQLVAEATDGSPAGTFVVESTPFLVSAGAPSQLAFSTQPTGALGGTAFTAQPVVAVEDAEGNVVSSANGTISLSITSSTGTSGAQLTCPAVTTALGVATFSGCTIDKAGSGYTLTASAPGLGGSGSTLAVTSAPFIVTANGAANVAFTVQPGNGTGGVALSTQPSVELTDSGGTPVSGSVQLALTGGPSGAQLTCAKNPASAGTGTAAFTGCSVNRAGTGYQLVATDPAVPGLQATSHTFSVTVGQAAQVAWTTSPSGATGGSAFTGQPTVAVEDLGGNPVPVASDSIRLAISAGTGAAGAQLSCTGGNTATTSSGTVTFAGCAIDKVGTGYVLTATADGFVAKSTSFAVTAGVPARLSFTAQPATGTVASPFGSQPQVTVTDAGGNPVNPATATVTLSPSSGSLTCVANPVSTTTGVASFASCQLAATGTYTLTASAPGLTSATSVSFTVIGGAPLGTVPVGVPAAQTFGGALYSRNTTAVTDDVDSATGALEFSNTDLTVAGVGEAFTLTRQYNSVDSTGGAFGPGWSSIFDAGVAVASTGKTAVVRGEDGQQLIFISNGAGGWIAPPGARATLTCSGAICTVTRFDGTKFTSSGGHIQSYLSAGGEGLHFTYTGNLLSAVTVQTSGAALRIAVTENATGQVTNVATPTRSTSYRYTNGNLTGYTDADGNAWTYVYGPTLTQEIDPLGQVRLSATYAGGRVASASALGSAKHFADTYTWDPTTQTSTRNALVTTATGPAAGTYLDRYKSNVLINQQQPDGATTAYSYDNLLDLTEVQDPLGHIQQMAYSQAGDMTSQSNPYTATVSAVTRIGYNAAHQITSVTDPNGNTTTYAYSGANLVTVTPPGPATGATQYLYNALGEQTEADTPTGIETFSYDAAGNQTGYQLLNLQRSTLDGLGPISTFDEAGAALTTTDARGHLAGGINPAYTTSYTYDPAGNLTSTTKPGPQTTSTTYTTAGDVASVTAASGVTTTYAWNEATLTNTATTSGTSATSTYDPSGDLLAQTTAGAQTTTDTYDTTGRLVTSTDPANVTTTYTYDLEGNVVATSDSAGHTGSFTYSPENQKLRSVLNGVATSSTYDPDGNLISSTDAAGHVTSYTFDTHEKMASVTTTAGTTGYGYDLSDNLTSVTDGNGHVISYGYNGAGQKVTMVVGGKTTIYAYDMAGNQISSTDPDGRTTAYTVNAQDLRTATSYSQAGQPAISITEQYNAAGQRTQMTDPTTGTHTYAYDAAGDLTSATNATEGSFSYNYATPGQMTETYPDGTQVAYTYDDAKNVMSVATIADAQGNIDVSYVRNAARQITGIAYSNGNLETQSYNPAGQVVSQILSCASTTEVASATSYDANGNPLANAATVGANTTLDSYGYNASGRLAAQSSTTSAASDPTTTGACTSGTPSAPGSPQQNDGSGGTTDTTTPATANQPAATPPTVPSTGTSANPIAYDAVGNQTSGGGTTTTYNSADEITAQTGASYTYDNAGDITTKTSGGVTSTYAYNAADQLVKVTTGATTVAYAYDGDGNRVSQTVTSGSTTAVDNYCWDPSGNVALLALERDGSGQLIRRYIYGAGPVAMQTPTGTYYLQTDSQGDVTTMSDDTGAIVETYTYDGFGNVTATPLGATTAPAEPLLFQGQYLDATTGLYDLRARNYDPTTGRFTQRDPVTPQTGAPVVSPYIFANDQPTTSGDSTGMLPSAVNSVLNGHSTESANIVSDTAYSLKAANLVVVKPIIALADYAGAFEKTAQSAVTTTASDSGEIADGLDAAVDSDAAGELSGTLGKGLGVIGIGLSVYLTVDTCMNGTVAQCVGASVGTAAAIGCLALTEGAGAVACGIAGAAMSYLISNYGPDLVNGLAQGNTAVIAITAVCLAVTAGIGSIGCALLGAHFAPEIAAAFTVAGDAIASGFITAGGAIATGFNKLGSAISSGYDSAVSSLEQAGYTALQMAETLEGPFDEGLNAVVNELGVLSYDVDGVAKALVGAFDETAAAAAAVLAGVEYGVNQIADGLKTAYAAAAATVAQILQGLHDTVEVISGALDAVYSEAAAGVATILKGLNYTIDDITSGLKSAYALAQSALTTVLAGVNYSLTAIAGALSSVYDDLDSDVATVFNEAGEAAASIATALQGAFGDADAAIAKVLTAVYTAAGEALQTAIDAVATGLETAFNETAETIASVLKGIGDDITAIDNMLTSVFNEATSDIESVLGDIGFSNSDIDAIGGAFASFGEAVASAFESAFSWL